MCPGTFRLMQQRRGTWPAILQTLLPDFHSFKVQRDCSLTLYVYLLKRQRKRGGELKEGEKNPLVPSPNAGNSQGWARWESGAQKSTWISWMAGTQAMESSSAVCQDALTGNWMGNRGGGTGPRALTQEPLSSATRPPTPIPL